HMHRQTGQRMDLHRLWDGVITSSQNLTRLRNEATTIRNRQEFQRSQLTEVANTDFGSWAKESFEIATKFAYRNDGRIGSPKGGNRNCPDVQAVTVLRAGYVVNASRIADRPGCIRPNYNRQFHSRGSDHRCAHRRQMDSG